MANEFFVRYGLKLGTVSGTTIVDRILNETDLGSNSATALATEYAIKTYVDNKVVSGSSDVSAYIQAVSASLNGGIVSVSGIMQTNDNNLSAYIQGVSGNLNAGIESVSGTLRTAINTTSSNLNGGIVSVSGILREAINTGDSNLSAYVQGVSGSLNAGIESVSGTLRTAINTTSSNLNGGIVSVSGILREAINTGDSNLSAYVNDVSGSLNAGIESVSGTLRTAINTTSSNLNGGIVSLSGILREAINQGDSNLSAYVQGASGSLNGGIVSLSGILRDAINQGDSDLSAYVQDVSAVLRGWTNSVSGNLNGGIVDLSGKLQGTINQVSGNLNSGIEVASGHLQEQINALSAGQGSGDAFTIAYNGVNYTETDNLLSGHLQGIDNALGGISGSVTDINDVLPGVAFLSAGNTFTGNNVMNGDLTVNGTFKATSAIIIVSEQFNLSANYIHLNTNAVSEEAGGITLSRGPSLSAAAIVWDAGLHVWKFGVSGSLLDIASTNDVANVGNQLSGYVTLTTSQDIGGAKSFVTLPTLSGTPFNGTDATNKTYVDTADTNIVNSLSGYLNRSTSQDLSGVKTFINIPVLPATDPTSANQAVRKAYVDAKTLGLNPTQSTSVSTSAATDCGSTIGDTTANGAVWNYSVSDGAGDLRAGTITAAWDASLDAVTFNEVSTIDLGDTSILTFAVVDTANVVSLQATRASGVATWTIKTQLVTL